MQQISYSVDPTKENEFVTVIGSRAGLGVVLIDGILYINIFDDIASATYDSSGGVVAGNMVPGGYLIGDGSTTSDYSGDAFGDAMIATLPDIVLEIDPTAELPVF